MSHFREEAPYRECLFLSELLNPERGGLCRDLSPGPQAVWSSALTNQATKISIYYEWSGIWRWIIYQRYIANTPRLEIAVSMMKSQIFGFRFSWMVFYLLLLREVLQVMSYLVQTISKWYFCLLTHRSGIHMMNRMLWMKLPTWIKTVVWFYNTYKAWLAWRGWFFSSGCCATKLTKYSWAIWWQSRLHQCNYCVFDYLIRQWGAWFWWHPKVQRWPRSGTSCRSQLGPWSRNIFG